MDSVASYGETTTVHAATLNTTEDHDFGYNIDFSTTSGSGYEYYEDDDDLFDLWEHYLKPNPHEWFVMVLYLIVFIVSLVGNGLIVVYICRRKHLQTTVNYFMLNLAIADILVTLIALPPTLTLDFLESWLLGEFLCKLTPYLQMTVTSVSALSLGAIAINRWYVVCYPLQVNRLQTSTRRAIVGMLVIWAVSLLTLSPMAHVCQLSNEYNTTIFPELKLLKKCHEVWGSSTSKAVFHLYYIIMCYASPLVVLTITYIAVFKELHRCKVPGYNVKKHPERRNGCTCSNERKQSKGSLQIQPFNSPSPKLLPSPKKYKVYNWERKDLISKEKDDASNEEQRSLNNQEPFKHKSVGRSLCKNLSLKSCKRPSSQQSCHKCSAEAKLLRSRHRSAAMQVALIVVFGICYAPAMLLDLCRQVLGLFTNVNKSTLYFVFSIAHLIMYLNSALNPIIYNCFSAHFRKEFRKTFQCLFKSRVNRRASALSASFFLSKWESKSRGMTQTATDFV